MNAVALWVAAALAGAPASTSISRPADHVIVIMLDGTRPDALRRAHAPVLDRLAAQGASYLQARTIYPSQTRVAFVTLPTGAYPSSHGVIGGDELKDASWNAIDTGSEDPIKAQQLVMRPTFFEEATAAGLTSLYAAMKGYELVGARGATWTINGKKTLDQAAYSTRYKRSVHDSEQLAAWYKRQFSRQLLDQALAIVREHKPNLVVINLGSNDYTAHTYGPGSPRYLESIEFLDGLIGELIENLRALGVLERTAFVVSADHGFSDVNPERVVAPASKEGGHVLEALAQAGIEHFLTNTGGCSMGLFLRDPRQVAAAVRVLRAQPWAEAVYCEEAAAGCDRTLRDLHAYFAGRSPQVMIDFDDDVALQYDEPGQHGSLRESDMRIPLILSGAGVARGVVLGKASLTDVAPTVVRLLGLQPKLLRPDGRVLEEALQPR